MDILVEMTHETNAYLYIAVVTCPIEQHTQFIIPLPQMTLCKWTDIELHRRQMDMDKYKIKNSQQ